MGAVAVVVALIGGLLVVTSLGDDDEEAGGEVFLEPAQSIGTDPFFAETDSLVDIVPVMLPAPEADSAAAGETTAEEVTTEAIAGSTPGLYGGTMDNSRCNRLQMVEFLEANPDKAAAWAGVHGIDPSEIREFVDTLTPAALLEDTRVTNHGFVNGRANPIQSVLQAGTAVLVDDTGLPRALCACGNPLAQPIPQTRTVTLSGPRWDGYDAEKVQVVAAGEPSEQLVLQDLEGGPPFARPTGTDGEADFEAPPEAIAAIPDDLLVPELGDPARTVPVGGRVTPGTATADPGTQSEDTATAQPLTSSSTTTSTAATTTAAPTTAPPTTQPRVPVDVTDLGTVEANSTYPGFPVGLAVDGNPGTSWFSVGPSVGPAVYTWSGPRTEIVDVSFLGNESHSNPDFRTGFGFGAVTLEVLDQGSVVFSADGSGNGSQFQVGATGDQVRLTFTGHEDIECGGFAELSITGLQ